MGLLFLYLTNNLLNISHQVVHGHLYIKMSTNDLFACPVKLVLLPDLISAGGTENTLITKQGQGLPLTPSYAFVSCIHQP